MVISLAKSGKFTNIFHSARETLNIEQSVLPHLHFRLETLNIFSRLIQYELTYYITLHTLVLGSAE